MSVTTDTYTEFLQTKQIKAHADGIEVEPSRLNAHLKPFQRALTAWAMRKGRAALFCDAGLGKSLMQMVFAQEMSSRSLIVAPLAVAKQTVREGEKFGIPVTYCRHEDDAPREGIVITNYQMVDKFDPMNWGAVVIDECFPPGTKIDTPLGEYDIESLSIGDIISNAAGNDRIVATKRKEINRATRIKTDDGKTFIASENHPFFTARGYVRACEIRPDDGLMETGSAMRLVRSGNCPANTAGSNEAVLRSVLLREMAHETAGVHRGSSYGRSQAKARKSQKCLASVRVSSGTNRVRPHSETQSYDRSANKREVESHAESHRTQATETGRKRMRTYRTTEDSTRLATCGVGAGSCNIARQATAELPDLLQGRYWQSQSEDSNRSGRPYSQKPEATRPEKGHEIKFFRVESVEVLELGHPELERFRDADGKLYFYDLQAERHPSFSVNGVLVHNSGILKDFASKTRNMLIEMFADVPYRLCCTATPAPNDIAEIGNHAEFLGIMIRVEMLSCFFVHDDKGWRLKRHAREPFYKWLASWAMSVKLPSNMGFDDKGYILPPLTIIPHFVEVNYRPEGMLFPVTLKGIGERSAVRKATLNERVAKAVEIVNAEPDESWLIYCGLNDESKVLTEALEDAVEVKGSDSNEHKENSLFDFAQGKIKRLISKAAICGHGMNMQSCARVLFVGLNDSQEQFYQAVRRCYRFGQSREVIAHLVLSDAESVIYENVMHKEKEADKMTRELIKHVAGYEQAEIGGESARVTYTPNIKMELPIWMR